MEIVILMYPCLAHRTSPDVVTDEDIWEGSTNTHISSWALRDTRPTGWRCSWQWALWSQTTRSVGSLLFHELGNQGPLAHQAWPWGQPSKWTDEEWMVAWGRGRGWVSFNIKSVLHSRTSEWIDHKFWYILFAFSFRTKYFLFSFVTSFTHELFGIVLIPRYLGIFQISSCYWFLI